LAEAIERDHAHTPPFEISRKWQNITQKIRFLATNHEHGLNANKRRLLELREWIKVNCGKDG
jgi:hypothetical protein